MAGMPKCCLACERRCKTHACLNIRALGVVVSVAYVSIAVKEITIFDQAIQRKWHVADFSEMELAKAVHRAVEDGAMASEGYIAEGEELTKPIAMFRGDKHRLTITLF